MSLTGHYVPGYPAIATNAAWQKKKSLVDKAKKATKTGLGAYLTAAETAYGKIRFDWLDAEKVGLNLTHTLHIGNTTPEEFSQLMEDANQHAYTHKHTLVDAAVNALHAAETHANETARNAALSPEARQAAGAIAQALHTHGAALHALSNDAFDAEAQKLKDHFQRG